MAGAVIVAAVVYESMKPLVAYDRLGYHQSAGTALPAHFVKLIAAEWVRQ